MGERAYIDYLKGLAAALLLGTCALPAYVEIFPMNFLNPEYAVWRSQLDYARTPAADDPEVLVMGDSRVHAGVIPALLGARSRSLALGGATPIDTYFLLEAYLGAHAPPRSILLSFAPFHLERQDRFWESSVKYKAWRASDYRRVFERSERLGDPVLGRSDRVGLTAEWALYRLNFPPYYLPELKNARLFGRRERNRRKREAVAAAAGHTFYTLAPSSSAPNQEVGRARFEASPLLDSYLRDFLVLAARHGIRVVLAAMPMNRSSHALLRSGYVEGYQAYLEALAADHPEAVVVVELSAFPDDHFGDASHLNERGARRVSRQLGVYLESDPQAAETAVGLRCLPDGRCD